LLREIVIDRANPVCYAATSYIPMRRGFLNLIAVMDWSTRKVLSWRISHTMDVEFCVETADHCRNHPVSDRYFPNLSYRFAIEQSPSRTA
jgi:putative transposase